MRTPTHPAGRRMPPSTFLHPAPWQEQTRGPRPGLSDLLAAQALLQAMEPGWRAQASAASLARLAAGEETALRRALARIQLRNLERVTPVAERAAQALRLTVDPTASTGGLGQ
jgi:hypothetical protein